MVLASKNCRVLLMRFCCIQLLFLVSLVNFNVAVKAEQIFEVPICPASKGLAINKKIELKSAYKIYVSIKFYFENKNERLLASKLAGTAYTNCQQKNTCGSIIPMHIKIFDQENKKILDKVSSEGGRDGFTENYYNRPLFDLSLGSGYYNFSIVALDEGQCSSSQAIFISVEDDGRTRR